MSRLVVASENITAFDEAGGHQGSDDEIEEQGDRGHQASKGTAETRAESQKAGEESDDAKEEGNQVESEQEARHPPVLVMSVTSESSWDADSSAKVLHGLEGVGGLDGAAIGIVAARIDTADVPESPS